MVEVFEMLQRAQTASEGMRLSPPDSSQVRKELMAKLVLFRGLVFQKTGILTW